MKEKIEEMLKGVFPNSAMEYESNFDDVFEGWTISLSPYKVARVLTDIDTKKRYKVQIFFLQFFDCSMHKQTILNTEFKNIDAATTVLKTVLLNIENHVK